MNPAYVSYNANQTDGQGGILPMEGIFSGRFYVNAEEKKASADANFTKTTRGSKKNNNN